MTMSVDIQFPNLFEHFFQLALEAVITMIVKDSWNMSWHTTYGEENEYANHKNISDAGLAGRTSVARR